MRSATRRPAARSRSAWRVDADGAGRVRRHRHRHRHRAGAPAAADRALLPRRSRRSRATGGTGLGLAIVKHVLLRHQAELEIASEPGKGSTFSVRLPARRVQCAPLLPENMPPANARQCADRNGSLGSSRPWRGDRRKSLVLFSNCMSLIGLEPGSPRLTGTGESCYNRAFLRSKSREGFPSGQREQTVNLSALPSKVRILPPPPVNDVGSRFRAVRAGKCGKTS